MRRRLAVELGDDLPREALLYLHRVDRPLFKLLAEVGKFLIRYVGGELQVVCQRLVRDRHELAVLFAGRVFEVDRVAKTLAHLLGAVGAHEELHDEAGLRLVPQLLLKLPPEEQVETLVRAAELHLRLDSDGVVCLEQRVEQFVYTQRLVTLVALAEILALEHLRDGEARGEPDHVLHRERIEPFALPAHLCPLLVNDVEELPHIGLGVRLHRIGGKHRTRGRLAARVADAGRPVTDDEHDLVPHLLQKAQLPQQYAVADVQVRLARIEPELQP